MGYRCHRWRHFLVAFGPGSTRRYNASSISAVRICSLGNFYYPPFTPGRSGEMCKRVAPRCQALSPLPPLPVTPGQPLDHLGCSSSLRQTTGPRPRAVRGQQQGLNTPPSGRESCYSSLPSKHTQPTGENWLEGFRVPPIPATPGRTQPTPSASRSDGAELTGEVTSILGTWCSHPLTGRYPNGHL